MEMNYLEEQPYFSRKNLELILGTNRRTLDDRIKTLINKGLLLRLKKGFYLSMPYYKKTNDKRSMMEYISTLLVYPSYISLEYALDSYNIIAESIPNLTLITLKKTRKINSNLINNSYRNIKENLYYGYETKYFENKQYQFATPAKAIFDFLYFIRITDLSNFTDYILNSSRINWENFSKQDKEELNNIIIKANSLKMGKIQNILKKNNIL